MNRAKMSETMKFFAGAYLKWYFKQKWWRIWFFDDILHFYCMMNESRFKENSMKVSFCRTEEVSVAIIRNGIRNKCFNFEENLMKCNEIYIYINIILKLLKVCDDKDSKGFSSSNRMSEHLWFDVLCWLFDETDPPDGRLGSSISDEWPQIISRITNARKKIFEHSKKLSKKEDRWCSWSIRERRYIINKEKKW